MKKKQIAITTLLVILFQILLNVAIPIKALAEDMVTIQCEDQIFYSRLVEALGDKVSSKNDAEMKIFMTQENVDSVTKLEISVYTTGEKMKNITGVEHFRKLTSLTIGVENSVAGSGASQISDINVIENLHNLDTLILRCNQIKNIDALSSLTNLTYICLTDNEIENIEPLSNLPNLKKLFIGGNNISDISSLEKCENIETLSVEGNNISNISVLEKLPNLKYLRLSSNHLGKNTYGPISGGSNPLDEKHISEVLGKAENLKNKLYVLTLENANISDLEWASNLENLYRLELDKNNISNISPIAGLINLNALSIGKNQISNISAIASLTNLVDLMLDGNQISDISVIEGFPKLRDNFTSFGNNKIAQTVASTQKEVELPQIIKAAKDSNNIIYTEEDYTLENCILSDDKEKIILNDNITTASIKINGGKARGTTFTVNVVDGYAPQNEGEENNNNNPSEETEESNNIQILKETNNTSNSKNVQTKDNTTATGILPQTGLGKTIFTLIMIITILGAISFIKTKKYRNI